MNDEPTKPDEVLAPRREYPLLAPQVMSKMLKLIDDNMGAKQFNILNLSRIKMPTGGDTEFKVETVGGWERRAAIECVITSSRQARVYWKTPYGSGRGTQPPDCSSIDGFVGVGDPGGACTACPLAAFKSARGPDGRQTAGQACKELRQLLVLLPGQMLPHVLALPPTSVNAFEKYTVGLLSGGLSCWAVTTRLSLEPATNAGGVAYARVRFILHSRLPEAEAQMLEPYQERMKGLLKPLEIDSSDYEIAEERPALPQTGQPQSPNDEIPF